MKTKNPMHPKFYIGIIKKNKDRMLVSYLSNKFNDDGDRVLQREEISNDLLQYSNSYHLIISISTSRPSFQGTAAAATRVPSG